MMLKVDLSRRIPRLVLDPVNFLGPLLKDREGFGVHEADHGDNARVDGFSNFVIDQVIIETDGSGVGMCAAVIDASGS